MKTYATFGITRSYWQVLHAFRSRKEAGRNMALLFNLLRKHEQLIEAKLGRPVRDLRILEVGLGQGMERARYFGIHNTVVGMDLDIMPKGFDLAGYMHLINRNGLGRFLKTIGRRVIIAGPNRRAWQRAVGDRDLKDPDLYYGDICETVPETAAFDVVVSWSVFEHLSNPHSALENIIQVLRPGGVLFISIHLYTSNNGHHDIRAFTGHADKLPPWGHLRPATQSLIKPSAFLNQWRLSQWRQLFSQLTPGYQEYLETHGCNCATLLNEELRNELGAYTDEELNTVDALYLWRKPSPGTNPTISRIIAENSS